MCKRMSRECAETKMEETKESHCDDMIKVKSKKERVVWNG